MKEISFKIIPEIIRVDLDQVDAPGWYVLVWPNPQFGPAHRDFYLIHEETGAHDFIFGCDVLSNEDAASLAAANGPGYTEYIARDEEI